MENNEQKTWLKITELTTNEIRYWNINQLLWITSTEKQIAFFTSTKGIVDYLFDECKIELISPIEMINNIYNK